MFRIGQRVVCIKDHSQKIIVRGQEFVIQNLLPFKCGCLTAVDVGIKKPKSMLPLTGCNKCDSIHPTGDVFYFASELFAPMDDKFADKILNKIIKQIKKEEIVWETECKKAVELGNRIHEKIYKSINN